MTILSFDNDESFINIDGIYVSAYFHYSNIMIIQCFSLWHYSDYISVMASQSSAITLCVQYNNKANVLYEGNSSIVTGGLWGESIHCYGWIPPLKWQLKRKSRISYACVNWIIARAKVIRMTSLRWYFINDGQHPSKFYPSSEAHKVWPITDIKRQNYDTQLLIHFQKEMHKYMAELEYRETMVSGKCCSILG